MGNYVNVLARKEGLRNPHITDVPPFKDENHPSEILRRFSFSYFIGKYNPFRKILSQYVCIPDTGK